MIKGILFDKDGTLIDFFSIWPEIGKRVIPAFLTLNGIEDKKIEEVVKELKDLNDINKLVNENYDYIKEKLDINNTVYTIDFENDNINFNKDNILSQILSYINEELEIKAKNEIELKNKNDVIERKNQENYKLEQEKEELELEKKQIIERNEALKKELEELYNSKR